MILEVFNMYVMSTVRFYESICISVFICIDLRWIQCCSIQSVQSVLPFWKSLFLLCFCFVSAFTFAQGQAQWQAAEPFCSKAWEATRGSGQPGAARGSPGQLWILSISKHVCTAVVHL